MPRVKKVPLRRCIVCREMKPKREMIRVVRTPQGEVAIDPTGKRSGRGAYVCFNESCLKGAPRGKRLEKELEAPVGPAVYEGLQEILSVKHGVPDTPSGGTGCKHAVPKAAGTHPEGGSGGLG